MPNRPRIPTEIEKTILIECGHRCSVCGNSLPLERAHIIPWHQSREHRAEDLICLCANCHERADKERWGESTLREYKSKPWILRQNEKATDIGQAHAKLVLTIDELPNFDSTFERLLPFAIAAFLGVSPDLVKIASIEKGSVKITLEIPAPGAEKLSEAFKRQDPDLFLFLAPFEILDLQVKTESPDKLQTGMKKGLFRDSVSIVIPAYNERETIAAVIQEATGVLGSLTRDYEVLVVDDGSTDGTGELADQAARADPAHVRVLHHEVNKGFAGAIKTCYANASKDWVFLAPADKQVDLSELANFVALTDGVDIVVGYRKHRADGIRREMNSYVFHLLCRIFFGIRLKQISTSKLYRRSLLQSIPLQAAPSSAMIEPEVIFKAMQRGARMVEVGMNHYPRAAGKPKGTGMRMIFNTFGEMFRLWWVLRVAPEPTSAAQAVKDRSNP